ncbi:hypothetical protein ABD86_07785 [Paenibacillus alvei]|nr:hypothetical protein [Paenibacillus alvei]MBG9743859.1 hypothetical protein [Paenibacillus alvei]
MSAARLKKYVGKYVFVRIKGKNKGFPSFVEDVFVRQGRSWITLWKCFKCGGPVQILYRPNQIASIRVVNDPLTENKCKRKQ